MGKYHSLDLQLEADRLMIMRKNNLLLLTIVLIFLAQLPLSSSSPGHYVHNYYKQEDYNRRGRLGQGREQERSPRHLNHRNAASAITVNLTLISLVAALVTGTEIQRWIS